MAPKLQDIVPQMRLGARVIRAAATLPQTNHAAIFTVTGGRVLLSLILGEVTTIIQAQANATKLTSYPTAGTAVDMCATVDINGLEVGGKITITGTAATAATKALAGSIVAQATPVIVAVGAIHLDCAASSTGAIKWHAYWMPLDDGAALVAA